MADGNSGAEVQSYSSAGQALLLLVLVPAYGAFASKVNRERLVTWVTLFLRLERATVRRCLQRRPPHRIVYFLWVGIFNVMVTARFWACANDLFTPEQGRVARRASTREVAAAAEKPLGKEGGFDAIVNVALAEQIPLVPLKK